MSDRSAAVAHPGPQSGVEPGRRATWLSRPWILGLAIAGSVLTNEVWLSYAAVIATMWIAVRGSRGQARMRLGQPQIAMIVFAIYAIASWGWSQEPDPESFRTVLWRASGIAAVFLSSGWESRDTSGWRFLGFAYLAGCIAAAGYVLWAAAVNNFDAAGRVTVGETNANYTGYSLATGIPIAFAMWSSRTFGGKGGKRRIAWLWACVVLLGVGTVLTGCRGAVIASCVATTAMLAKALRVRPFRGLLMASAVGLVLSVWWPSIVDAIPRRLTLAAWVEREDVTSGRIAIWTAAWEQFLENPVLGAGAYSFESQSSMDAQPHNVFLTVLAELGVLGSVLFTLVLILVLRRVKLRAGGSELWMASTAMVAVWLIIGFTGVWLYALPGWVAFAWFGAAPMSRTSE